MSDQITVLNPGQAKFESLLEAAPIAMVGFDFAGVIWFVNRQSELLFGLDRDQMIGQYVELLMPRSLRRMLSGQGGSLIADPATEAIGASLELTGRRRDGSEFPVEINLSSIQTEDGLLVTAAVRDVTDRRKENQDLQGLAALIKYSDDAIIGKTLDGIVTSWNPAAERMYGYLSQEMIGRSINLIFPSDRPDEMNLILAKIKGGQPTVHVETVRVRKDGTVLPVSLTVSPVLDAGGAVIGASAIAHDVTKQMQAFKDARSMIESSLDSLVSISPDGMITDLNEATIKVTGVVREELIGTAFSDYFTEPQKANRIYQMVFAEGMAVDYPLTMRHRDGTLTEVLYNASVYRDAMGKALGVFAAARDVTTQMQAQAEVADQLRKELQRLAELEQFQRLTVGREIKMIELKKEIEVLRKHASADEGSSDDWN